MMDWLEIGSTPAEEPCEQVGTASYDAVHARQECKAFIEAIIKKCGPVPEGASLRIKSCPHDFGSYMEVACFYDVDDEKAIAYAYKCEAECPTTWAEVGMERP